MLYDDQSEDFWNTKQWAEKFESWSQSKNRINIYWPVKISDIEIFIISNQLARHKWLGILSVELENNMLQK